MPIQTFSEQFSLLGILLIFAFVLASFSGFAALSLLSILFLVALLALIYLKIRSGKLLTASFFTGWALIFASALLTQYWLQGLWLTPSQDDTLNHLGFLDAILSGRHALLGKINRPGADWFGESAYHFYPTGSHAWAAILIEPLRRIGVDWVVAYRFIIVASIAVIPGLLWWSSEKAFPKIPFSLRLFLVIAASTQASFPLDALGEGGISRIIAMSLLIPLWFSVFTLGERRWFGLAWSAVIAPSLLFVHPSLLPLLAVAVLFFNRKTFLAALAGAPLGAVLFLMILRSAPQEVTQPELIETILRGIRSDAWGWFERLKGPFHYWFSDSMGFAKFLSPKNYWIYFAVGLAIARKVSRKTLLLFAIPFAMAALALVRHPLTDQLGLIFYHSTKRIAELTPLLGFTLATFAAQFIFSKREISKAQGGICLALAAVFLILFVPASKKEIEHFNELFHSPTQAQIETARQKLKLISSNERILIDRHEYNYIRFLVNQPAYTLEPECAEVGTPSPYCQKRRAWAADPASNSFWLIPKAADDTAETEKAKKLKRNVIELAADAHLIEVPATKVIQ